MGAMKSSPADNFKLKSNFMQYWNAIWWIAIIGFIGRMLESYIGYRSIGFLFLFGVLVVGLLGQFGPVLFAGTISALSWNYFFIPPRFDFAIHSPEDAFLFSTYFVVAIATGWLANRAKRQELIILEREERTQLLYEVMLDISGSHTKIDYLEKIADRLSSVLGGNCAFLLKGPSHALQEPIHPYSNGFKKSDSAIAKWCLENGKLAGWSTSEYEDESALFVPLKGNEETVGVLKYEPQNIEKQLSIDQENLLQSVCRQLAVSLEREIIDRRLREADRLKESEKMHQILLNSISHEVRTPLTALIGSASALQDEKISADKEARLTLTNELAESSARLNRVVENLLDMSRISSRGFAIKKEWHDMSDVIGVAIARLAPKDLAKRIKTSVPADLPLVEIDFRLFEHALFNIVYNALFYSPSEEIVEIKVAATEGAMTITVDDRGKGIPIASLPYLFDKFYRVPGSPTGGTGLGLSIAKGIVEIHHGHIHAENRAAGGASFVIGLPLKSMPPAPEAS